MRGKGHMILAVVAAGASSETFTGLMDHVAQGFEALGAAILMVGVIWSFVLAAVALRRSERLAKAYLVLRQAFGGTLLLGLEILVAADLVRTVTVAPTLDNVLVLGLIVVIQDVPELLVGNRDRGRCASSSRRTPSEAAGGGMDCPVGLVPGPNCREVRGAEAARNWLIWIHQRPGTKDPSSSK